jgi:hypothetical protein
MKRTTLPKTLAITGMLTILSCGFDAPRPGVNAPQQSVLAALGGINTKPDGAGELSYELKLITDPKNNLPPIIGTIKNSSTEALIEFKRTTENPLTVGQRYQLTVIGDTKTDLYKYLDAPLTDKKSIYHITSIGEISADNTLKLISVKRYNDIGAGLFNMTLKIANTEIGVVAGAKASLDCTGREAIAANMTATLGEFLFEFNTTTIAENEALVCTNLHVLVGNKEFVNKEALNLSMKRETASFTKSVILEEKTVTQNPGTSVSAEIVNQLNGSFANNCEKITPVLPATPFYLITNFEFKITAGANTGTAVKSTSRFSDKDCKYVSSVYATNYELELLNPAMVSIPNTLPISFFKITGTNRSLETHTIVNIAENRLQFGAKVEGSDAWSGSKDLNAIPKTLNLMDYIKKAAQP